MTSEKPPFTKGQKVHASGRGDRIVRDCIPRSQEEIDNGDWTGTNESWQVLFEDDPIEDYPTCMVSVVGLSALGVSYDELKKAFCDVLDGNYQPYEIQAQTGMTMERCEEISNLFKRLVKS